MQIAIVVLLSLILISNLFILAKASRLNPKKFMELFTTQNAESVETAIITELINLKSNKMKDDQLLQQVTEKAKVWLGEGYDAETQAAVKAMLSLIFSK